MTTSTATDDTPRARPVVLLLGAWVVVTATAVLTGFLVQLVLGPGGSPAREDLPVNRWLAQRRTATLDTLSSGPSFVANTIQVVVIVLVVTAVAWLVLRRWREPLALVAGMALEVSSFVVTSLIVGEQRPSVQQLDPAPPTGSFPSGHVAGASALYVGIALLVWSTTTARWPRAVTAILAVAMPVAVALSRLYRGMHYVSDVLAGATLGAVCAVVGWSIVVHGRPWALDRLRGGE